MGRHVKQDSAFFSLKWLLAAVLVLAVLGGSLFMFADTTVSGPAAPGSRSMEPGTGQPSEAEVDAQVEKLLASMSTTEKVGQLVMVGVHGTDVNEDSLYMLHQFHFGGIVLFDRNMESKEQTRLLVQHLQEQSEEKLPLFVAVDEEGGLVARGKSFLEPPPSQAEIGATGRPEEARRWAAWTAQELKAMGFNVNFAPVADVGSGRERSYSDDPSEVLSFVKEAGRGYTEQGLFYCLKHFPGIGRGVVDSHKDISSIEAGEAELMESDLLPFRGMFEATGKGAGFDYFVMVGHLNYPAYNEEKPASLSREIMTGLLRDKLGYQGLIITDDLAMGAVIKQYPLRRAGAEAIKAGADIALICHEYENQEAVYMGILEAVQDGSISEERLDESVRRVLKAKLLHGLLPGKDG